MRLSRIVYTVILIVSLGMSFGVYYAYHLRDEEIIEYRRMSRESQKAIKEVRAELEQNKMSLGKALKEVANLNSALASLRDDNVDFKNRMHLIKLEEEELKKKIAVLIEEKTVLEKKLVSFKEKVYSIEELKEALKIAKMERRRERRAQRVQKHLTKIAMYRKLDELATSQGNRGYVVRGGRTTFGLKPTIRVELEAVEGNYYK